MTVKRSRLLFALLPAAMLAIFWQQRTANEAGPEGRERVDILQAPFTVWNDYAGTLESRSPLSVASQLHQPATLTYLAKEGSPAKAGDLLAEFDHASLQRELNKLKRDQALASAELKQLLEGDQPLELQELESQVAKTQAELLNEQQYLSGSRELAAEGLMSQAEIEQQQARVQQLEKALAANRHRLTLTRDVLHPSQHAQAQAHLDYVTDELALVAEQQQQTRILAPQDGTVIYKPLHVNNEFRTVRVGDTVYRNQSFMLVADMSSLVVHCDIPESQLSHVREGQPCIIKPLPFPSLELRGTVLRVGSMAHSVSGKPAWQKFFHVVIQLDDGHGSLRSGMSVTTRITSYHRQDALLIPRAAVYWEQDQAYSLRADLGGPARTPIDVGMANDLHYEVLRGLGPGDRVWQP